MGETDNMGSQEMVAGVGGLRRVEYQQEGEEDTRGLGLDNFLNILEKCPTLK